MYFILIYFLFGVLIFYFLLSKAVYVHCDSCTSLCLFMCTHQLISYNFHFAGELQTSTYPGRIIVTEPKGSVQPRINVEKHSSRHVILNGQIILPCIAQGHPVPTYR